jgi:hypothetical protein
MRDQCRLSPKLEVSVEVSGKGLRRKNAKDLLPCLLDHFDEHLSCLQRGRYRVKEVDASAFDSIACLQAQSEAQAVD